MRYELDEIFESDLAYAFNEALCQANDAGKNESMGITAFVLSRKEVRKILMKAQTGGYGGAVK
jgi:hypothetical protein